VVVSVS